MSVIDTIRDYVSRPTRVPNNVAIAVASTERGRVAKTNARRLRTWSERSEWIRAAINIRKTQVSGAEWDIVPADPDGPAIDLGLQKEIRDRLEFANPKAENFNVLMDKIVEDIIVLDAGVIEIEPNLIGEPLYFHDVAGEEVRVSSLWDGMDPDEPRYFWYPDNFERGRWTNDQIVYIMETSRTNSVVGLSKLETLALSIDSELDGHAFNARQVRNAAPDGLLHLGKGAKQENVESFRAFWQAEQGRGAMAITGGSDAPAWLKFHDSNRDMQFLEWQIYLVRKIAAVMGMDPGDLGIGMDINRSTAEVRDNQTEDRGIRPLMNTLAKHITREIVWHPGFGGQDNNLRFHWTKLNLKESAARAAIYKIALGGTPYMSVNEARKETGRDPWGPEFDDPIITNPQGTFSLKDIPTIREFLDMKNQAKELPSGATDD
ncbi:MAG TPA: phage portal protein [Actinomycetes bacterium]|nr:phage portal protein [Actinomycetes bacterium]